MCERRDFPRNSAAACAVSRPYPCHFSLMTLLMPETELGLALAEHHQALMVNNCWRVAIGS